MNMQDEKYPQKSKSISSEEANYFVHFAMRYPVLSKCAFTKVCSRLILVRTKVGRI